MNIDDIFDDFDYEEDTFEVGDWVLIKHKPSPTLSIVYKIRKLLSLKDYPNKPQIDGKIGDVNFVINSINDGSMKRLKWKYGIYCSIGDGNIIRLATKKEIPT